MNDPKRSPHFSGHGEIPEQTWPKTKVNQTSNQQKERAKPVPTTTTNLLKQELGQELRQSPALQKIYGATTTPKNTPEQVITKPNLVDVAIWPQLMAWVIDIFIIALGTMFIILCSSFLTFGDFIAPFYSPFSRDFYLLFSTLFALFYLFYFTLLDLNSSVGKSLFTIKVMPVDKDQIEMKDTFIRAFVTLVSLMGLGIPTLLDFQGKLSKTTLKK